MGTESLPRKCPQCSGDVHKMASGLDDAQELAFCLRCRFPLMLVAGKYRMQKLLAEGGFATVYLAHHVGLQRDPERVVKVLKPEVFKIPNMEERFFREVQLTSALSQLNEHIVRIHDDFGVIDNLGRFYVMEYLEGNPLTRMVQEPKKLPSLKLCLFIFGQICDAMESAHRDGIVHRDLKPDNIFLTSRGEFPYFVKVLDFGIAKPLDLNAAQTAQFTQGTLGTPPYMSPEQCVDGPIDHRSDIYSMGVILYELLVGHTPFYTKGKPRSVLQIIQDHVQQAPPPLRSLRPDRQIPQALEEVVMRALSKEPDERFFSAKHFRDSLADAVPALTQALVPRKDIPAYQTEFPANSPFPLRTPSSMTYLGGSSWLRSAFEQADTLDGSDEIGSGVWSQGPLASADFGSLPGISTGDVERFRPKTIPPDNQEQDGLDLSFKPSHSYRRPLLQLLMLFVVLGVMGIFSFYQLRRLQSRAATLPKRKNLCGVREAGGGHPKALRVLVFSLDGGRRNGRKGTRGDAGHSNKQILTKRLLAEIRGLLKHLGDEWLLIRHSTWPLDNPTAEENHHLAKLYGARCRVDLVLSAARLTSGGQVAGNKAAKEEISWLRLFATYTGAPLSMRVNDRDNKLGQPMDVDSLVKTDTMLLKGRLRALLEGLLNLRVANAIKDNETLTSLLVRRASRQLHKMGFSNLRSFIESMRWRAKRRFRLPPRKESFVPPGEFMAGDEKQAVRKVLTGFWIDREEVSREAYAMCVLHGKCPRIRRFLQPPWKLPRDRVAWSAARDYCAFEGKKLPTEEQWEKAARGGLKLKGKANPTPARLYPWGDETHTCERSNNNWCYKTGTGKDQLPRLLPVDDAHKDISPYGIFHLAGNVSEIVRDGKIKGGSGVAQVRTISWNANMDQRKGLSWVGFRCVRASR